jgi:hypothetical protein
MLGIGVGVEAIGGAVVPVELALGPSFEVVQAASVTETTRGRKIRCIENSFDSSRVRGPRCATSRDRAEATRRGSPRLWVPE